MLTSEVDPRTGEPIPLRPETALDLAREEVIRLRKEGLLAGRAITFDAATDWTIMAWDAFRAEEFPFDEARKLALALGLEMEDLLGPLKLVAKKGNYVVLQRPAQRRKKGIVDPDAAIFPHLIDAVHTAMDVYAEDGPGACDVFLQIAASSATPLSRPCFRPSLTPSRAPASRASSFDPRPTSSTACAWPSTPTNSLLHLRRNRSSHWPGQGGLFEADGGWESGDEDESEEE